MPLVADRCICLRKVEFSETSQILTLFARTQGIVRVIAKGAHRTTKAGASKFGGGIDLLDVAEAVFSHAPHRELPPLTEWRLTEGHRELRRNLRGIYLAIYSVELIAALIEEHDPHMDLFDRLEQTLAELATPRREQAFLALELDLLREAGLMPELGRCISCGRSIHGAPQAALAVDQGGVVCHECALGYPNRFNIDPRLLRVVQTIVALPRVAGAPQRLPVLTRHQTDPLNRLLAEHIRYAVGRPLRLARYVLSPSL